MDVFLTHSSLASSFVGHRQISADPDQMLQNTASDQGLHCLLTECLKKSATNKKIYHQTP